MENMPQPQKWHKVASGQWLQRAVWNRMVACKTLKDDINKEIQQQ